MPLRSQIAAMALNMIDRAEHWHTRAEELRTMAEDVQRDEAKELMLRIAADYDRLAENAETTTDFVGV
jgi:hypothetical protein